MFLYLTVFLLTAGFKELYLLNKGNAQATRRQLLDNLAALPSTSTNSLGSSPVLLAASGTLSAFTIPRNIQSPAPAPAPHGTKPQSPDVNPSTPAKTKQDFKWIYVVALPVLALLLTVVAFVLLVTQEKTRSAIKPWKSGISGQLQKAFVTGMRANCLFLHLVSQY
jgi:hypothetical protein